MKTFFANEKDYQNRPWETIDATNQVVGRLAVRIARILMGKTEATFTPHVETGHGVIVTNAAKVVITGNKAKTKLYKNFSGFPSGLRERTFERVMASDPTYVLMQAVKGMLPKSVLGRRMLTHLLIYPGAEHPHTAQKPKAMKV